MSVYKRGNVWWMRFEFNGKRYEKTTGVRNQREAEKIERHVRLELGLGRYGLTEFRPSCSLVDFEERFFQYITPRCTPNTASFYRKRLKTLLQFGPFKDKPMSAIDAELIGEYIRFRSGHVKVATVNHELTTLRRCLGVAKDEFKLLAAVPKIQHLPGKGARDFVLSYEQEAAYLACCPDTLRDVAILSLDTGVRVGEALALEWSDVSFQPAEGSRLGSIRIRRGKTKNAKRILSMSPRVKAMLENRRRFFLPVANCEADRTDWSAPQNTVMGVPRVPAGTQTRFVFPGRSPGTHVALTTINTQHVQAREKARLPDGSTLPTAPDVFVVHSLRHTFATRLGMVPDVTAFDLMKVLGHATIAMSAKYVHPTPDHIERAFERFDLMNRIMRGEVEVHPTPTTSQQDKG